MALHQDQRDFFAAHGYLPYERVLDDRFLAGLRAEYDRVFDEARETGAYRNLAIDDGASIAEKREAPVQVAQVMQMCERSLLFRQLLYHAPILDAVEDLIGPNILLFHDQALYKPARTGGAVFWHQDNAYWRLTPSASVLSCWLTLDEVTIENGAMQFIPGSHLQPHRHETSESTKALLDATKQIDTSKAVVVELPAGACLFHHCQTLHYTAPNATDRQRRAFAMHYMPPGTRHVDAAEPLRAGWNRPALRLRM